MKRFHFFDDPSGDILKHADEIEIKLIKFTRGFGIEFKISGGFLPDLEDEDDEDGATCSPKEQPDASEVADNLLQRFIKAKGGAQ